MKNLDIDALLVRLILVTVLLVVPIVGWMAIVAARVMWLTYFG